jgi:hypothetical protein
MCFGEFFFDNSTGQVDPSLAAVQHYTVTAGNNGIGFYQFAVRA